MKKLKKYYLVHFSKSSRMLKNDLNGPDFAPFNEALFIKAGIVLSLMAEMEYHSVRKYQMDCEKIFQWNENFCKDFKDYNLDDLNRQLLHGSFPN